MPSSHIEDTWGCSCAGDIFSCRWDCGDGKVRGASSWINDVSGHDSPGENDLLCFGKPDAEYCDCGGDCSSSLLASSPNFMFCDCAEAQAASCCGKFANATGTKTRKQTVDDKKMVASHNDSTSPGQWKGYGKETPGEWQNKSARDNPGEFVDRGHSKSQYHDEGLKDSKWAGKGSDHSDPADSDYSEHSEPGASTVLATSPPRARKHGGGRSMALLPLLWSHGDNAGPGPGEKGQPNTRW